MHRLSFYSIHLHEREEKIHSTSTIVRLSPTHYMFLVFTIFLLKSLLDMAWPSTQVIIAWMKLIACFDQTFFSHWFFSLLLVSFSLSLSLHYLNFSLFFLFYFAFHYRAFKCTVWTKLDNAGAWAIATLWRFNHKSNKRWTNWSDGRTFTSMDIHRSTFILDNINHNNR